MSRNQTAQLVSVTLKMYWASLKDAFKGTFRIWWAPLWFFGYGVVLYILGMLVAPLGLVGGLILGLTSAFLMSHLFSLVRAAALNERIGRSESWSAAKELFSPLISVLFLFWIILMVIGYFEELGGKGTFPVWIPIAFNLILLVIFNPIPEVVVFGGYQSTSAFSASLEFMRENAVEWLAPTILLLALVTSASPYGMVALLQSFGLFHFFAVFASFAITSLTNPVMFVTVVIMAYLTFAFLVFRGSLYQRLANSTRRKRLYQLG